MFHSGEYNMGQIAPGEDCIGLVPIIVRGSFGAIVRYTSASGEEQRQISITLGIDSVLIMSGRCSVILPDQASIVCAIFCVWRE